MLGDIPGLLPTREIGSMVLNPVFIVVALVLVAVSAKRLSTSFTAFAAATVLLALAPGTSCPSSGMPAQHCRCSSRRPSC